MCVCMCVWKYGKQGRARAHGGQGRTHVYTHTHTHTLTRTDTHLMGFMRALDPVIKGEGVGVVKGGVSAAGPWRGRGAPTSP